MSITDDILANLASLLIATCAGIFAAVVYKYLEKHLEGRG